ncbi:DNA-dependent metalloprotease WSS1 [Cyphellophora attinorum]|uniref:DNA-dependent metalloprotease WSS1 n=1 Tax=Cyphellophora attinorum TaxID=1664694 RepID=A0A0N1H5I0_9EURO|nr:DNA-dependent metalloprotease WSS1 [Phialophora attinorum]KPI36275.1 DNA-dependent metalloprotease WSS1 [Phialophora attinorum]
MSRAVSTELEPLVNNFEHLADKRRAAEALQTLRKIASLVKPLMRQRNWRVGTLAEFYPPENNLLGLNINAGQKICLRLRHAGDDTQFLPIEQVTDTMLHELAHNVHALVMKGYTGEGFLSNGNRLGGRRIPLSEARRQARAAAERRKTLTTNSGQRLGGTGIMRGQDPRQIIAAAAQRRQQIERGCASNTAKGREIAHDVSLNKNVERTQVDQEDEDEATLMQAYIDLIQEDEKQQLGDLYIAPSQENPAGSKALPPEPSKKLVEEQRKIEQQIKRLKQSSSSSLSTTPSSRSNTHSPIPPPLLTGRTNSSKPPLRKPEPEPEPITWTCEICTLVNPLQYLTCDACGVERPAHISASLPSNPPPVPHTTRPTKNTTSSTPSALLPRQNAYANHKRFDDLATQKQAAKPIGWSCGRCGNFMEQEWWTCSNCGGMRDSS